MGCISPGAVFGTLACAWESTQQGALLGQGLSPCFYLPLGWRHYLILAVTLCSELNGNVWKMNMFNQHFKLWYWQERNWVLQLWSIVSQFLFCLDCLYWQVFPYMDTISHVTMLNNTLKPSKVINSKKEAYGISKLSVTGWWICTFLSDISSVTVQGSGTISCSVKPLVLVSVCLEQEQSSLLYCSLLYWRGTPRFHVLRGQSQAAFPVTLAFPH